MSTNQRIVFVNNLCRTMKMRGVDQSDIVSALGYSASTVSDWVNGKKYPRVDAMQRLADFLGVLISDLTTEEKDTTDAENLKDALVILDPSEKELVTIYRDLNAKGQDAMLTMARSLKSNPEMKRGGESKNETA